jgi:aryl-phospho-beta-D-glucosidase BglC (GH1 family)
VGVSDACKLHVDSSADEDRYFLKAISWGRKYGIRILLDFHALPGTRSTS